MSVRLVARSLLHCDLALQRLSRFTVSKSPAHNNRCLVQSFKSLPAFRCNSMSSHTSADSTGTGVSVVYVTVPSEGNVAKSLAGSIITNKLAACVNILPGVTSVYHWEGKLEEDQEQLLIIKTQTALIEELTKHVQSNHPYDECEVISLPVTGGSSSYLSWVVASATGMK